MSGDGAAVPAASDMPAEAVHRAYRRWAPFYDLSFGVIAGPARRAAVDAINAATHGRPGAAVLEVGVGTGLALVDYDRGLKVTGIDLSTDMLARARARAAYAQYPHVAELLPMDAARMAFGDGAFDAAAAMFVMTVVPEPEAVLAEMARVVRPGGRVVIVNHFSQDEGVRGRIERAMAPYGQKLGWRPVFPLSRVLGEPRLRLVAERPQMPMGLFTLVELERIAG